ncbi:MAG: cobalamin-binding protein [Acidimicrobiales bacterium]|nr:cobalamin-binding protein [Acidimicrobiales bacterium]
MPGRNQLIDARRAFLHHVIDGDVDGARRLGIQLLRAHPAERIILDVLVPTQGLVGRRWETSRLSVADEHVATAVTDAVLAQVAAAIPAATGGLLVALACAEGDWHSMPARMATELLRARGLQVRFLGASLPAADLAAYLAQLRPAALCLTCSVPSCLPGALRSIAAAHGADTPVMAGGRGFGPDSHAAARLGADGWARSPDRAMRRLVSWSAGRRPVTLASSAAEVEAWSTIELETAAVADRMVVLLGETVPEVHALDDGDPTLADLHSVVEHLAVTLLVDDDRILADHIAWLQRVMSGRGFPASTTTALLPALNLALAEHDLLSDRTQRALHGARAASPPHRTEPSGA